jgi:acyl-CoA thioester hydrolase
MNQLPGTEQFHFSTPIQVRWTDLDPLNHVNNSIYIQYFEFVRGLYMLEACPTWDWQKDMFLIASVHCDYIKELKIGQPDTRAHVRTARLGTKSFELQYAITTQVPGKPIQLHAVGSTVQVMFDTHSRTTMPIPDWVKNEILAYEKEGSVMLK